MKVEDLLKLYDNAIYLDDASKEEVKNLLKLGKQLVEQIDEHNFRNSFSVSKENDYMRDVLHELHATIDNFKELRI